MRGPSRASIESGQERLEALVRQAGVDRDELASSLFGVANLLASNPGLRRALADPSRPADSKSGLLHQLLGQQVSPAALTVLDELVHGAWSDPSDLTTATERLAVLTTLISAETNDRFDAVEDELFRFSRLVAGDSGLRDAFATRTPGSARKSELVNQLLGGKVAPETLALVTQAATATRGRRTEQVLEEYLKEAADRRHQLAAHVVVAADLSERQRERLSSILQRMFDRPIRLNVDVDPDVIGGIRVEVAGELLDSTVIGRLNAVQRAMVR